MSRIPLKLLPQQWPVLGKTVVRCSNAHDFDAGDCLGVLDHQTVKVIRTRRNALVLSSPILKYKAGKLCKICAFTTPDDVATIFFRVGTPFGSEMTPSMVFQMKPGQLSIVFPPGGPVLSTTLLFRNGVAFCVSPELAACVVLMHGPLSSFVFCPTQQAKPCLIFFELLSMEENGPPFCCNPLSFCFAKLKAQFPGDKPGPSLFSADCADCGRACEQQFWLTIVPNSRCLWSPQDCQLQ